MESSLEIQSLNEKDSLKRKAKKSKKNNRNDEYLLNNRISINFYSDILKLIHLITQILKIITQDVHVSLIKIGLRYSLGYTIIK